MKTIKIIYWSIVISFCGAVFYEAFRLHKKYTPDMLNIQHGQQWARVDENPFKKADYDTLNIIDVKKGYVQYYIRHKHKLDTQSTIRGWFDNGFYTRLK